MATPFTFQQNAYAPNSSLVAKNNNNNNNSASTINHISNSSITLGPYDIICGRTSKAWNNVGNRRFRVTISLNLQQYLQAKNRNNKSQVIMSVVRLLRDDIGARFLKRRSNVWIEVDENKAREKVGHALRDMAVLQEQQEKDKEEQKQRPTIDNEEPSKTILETTTSKPHWEEETIDDKKTTTDITKNNIITREDTLTLPQLGFSCLYSLDIDSLFDLCGDIDDDSMDPLPLFQYVAEKA